MEKQIIVEDMGEKMEKIHSITTEDRKYINTGFVGKRKPE